MARKRFFTEQIITKLREAEVRLAQGKTVVQACKQMGITEQTYYRWRKEYGGLKAITHPDLEFRSHIQCGDEVGNSESCRILRIHMSAICSPKSLEDSQMIDDTVVEEIRQHRKAHATEHGNGLERTVQAIRKPERKSDRPLLNPEPKHLSPTES